MEWLRRSAIDNPTMLHFDGYVRVAPFVCDSLSRNWSAHWYAGFDAPLRFAYDSTHDGMLS